MLSFLPGAQVFAIAGLLAAAGPVVIHLLNRRRFKVIDWAAMDFLLEALQRNRKMLQLRDLLLLLLRTAALALFGLALARPYFASSSGVASPNAPVHAILVMDNSLSMGHEKLGGSTLLDEARTRAKEFVDQLPLGSRISVLPLCGSAGGFSVDAYRTKEDAIEAIDKIEVVDRAGSAAQAADIAIQASRQVPELPNKRVVFLGDQQVVNWPSESIAAALKDLPEMQVVSIAPDEIENSWIDSFKLEDGVADVESPAAFTAVVRHKGSQPRSNVQVVLTVDGLEVATETIDLQPDQDREVTFPYRFDVATESNKPTFATAKVSIPGDRLPQDDSRYLAAPVVAALPVVFADQYGSTDENPQKNRYGETRHLRRLLAPVTSRLDIGKQLVQVRHVKIDQIDKQLLEDARMVVIAGVASPEGTTPLLREFVKQGGQLVICAGAEFDLAAWNQTGWLEGSGILPVPLKATVGKLPDEPGELRPFFLAYNTMKDHEFFHLAGVPEEDLQDLYNLPLFFKAIESDTSDAALKSYTTAETKRLTDERQQLAALDEQFKKWTDLESKGQLTEEQRQLRASAEVQRESLEPAWLQWAETPTKSVAETPVADLIERNRPRVLAAFDNGVPFLVSRGIGRGQVLWVASGMFSDWNNLPKTNAMLMFDRVLRGMLERTLPKRNLESIEQLTLPVAESDRNATIRVTRPDGMSETLSVDALGGDLYGVAVRDVTERGIYTVAATKPDLSDRDGKETKLWEVPLAVNGPGRESEPAVLDALGFAQRVGKPDNVKWIGRGERINLEGARVSGQDFWWWLMLGVLACLLIEFAVLGYPQWSRQRTA